MSLMVKNEFYRFIESIDCSKITAQQTKILNLLVQNFDEILPLGIASGRRAKKISEIIQEQHSSIPTSLLKLTSADDTNGDSVSRISEIEIGPFRGFTSKEVLGFNTQYIFLYGPNGSGKSSFCEGLEYSLLGEIEEASAKRMSTSEYINNTVVNRADVPILYAGTGELKKNVISNPSKYRFAFIEKNRIDAFARITAVVPSEQKNRIATLFGLEAFSEFVDAFTDDLNKYLPLEAVISKGFEAEKLVNDRNEQRKIEIIKEYAEVSEKVINLVEQVDDTHIIDLDSLKTYLIGADGLSGIINELQRQKAEKIDSDIPLEQLENLSKYVCEMRSSLKTIEIMMNELRDNATQMNFSELYNAVVKVEQHSKDFCPACLTPLSDVTKNPYEVAKNEIEELKNLSRLQSETVENIKTLVRLNNDMRGCIDNINKYMLLISKDFIEIIKPNEKEFNGIKTMESWSAQLKPYLFSMENVVNKLDGYKAIICQHNLELQKKREAQTIIDAEILKYQSFENSRNEFSAILKRIEEEKSNLEKLIEEFLSKNASKVEEIESEKIRIDLLKSYGEAYNTLLITLRAYRDELPLKVSENLNDKSKEYYNIINSHDPDFEKIEMLAMPTSTGQKIKLKFVGSTKEDDALHVLSEGHLKVLGLSILLAKVNSEALPFIIFDDVVNAIDDDHRSGIAELLITHPDFKNVQQIITCHGEQFINKLEHKLGQSRSTKEVTRYRFYPADTIASKGVKLSIGSSRHYIVQAEEAINTNELKNALSKCRQAVESISETLWKKLSKHINLNLTVKVRTPGGQPDLSSVVDSLIKEIKSIDNNSELYLKLSELKSTYNWILLNKGTHEQDDLPEFDRSDVSKLVELIKIIENLVVQSNFSVTLS